VLTHIFAFPRHAVPGLCISLAPSKSKEGAGKAGCRPHPWPASKQKSWRQTPQDWPNNRPSLRNGFTAYTYSPRGPGFLAPVIPRLVTARLDTSVGVSGPHDFAVRIVSFVRAQNALRSDASIASPGQRS